MESIRHDPPHETGSAEPEALRRRLDAALGALPRVRASRDFTDQVMARLERRRGAQRQWQALAAAALVLLAVGLGLHQWERAQERQAAALRLSQMQAEYAELAGELQDLRREAERARPLVYLTGTGGDVELVLDLSRLASSGKAGTAGPDNGSAGDGETPSAEIAAPTGVL
ncbi:MAG: hypothetical protein MI919_00640 [Holophagales bacterium]|nr:hypothetical protein [Holophagales bacterium]